MRWLVVAAALALPGGAAALTLEQAVATALENDPELKALGEERKAAGQARDAAGSLLAENPTLSLEGGPMYGEGERVPFYVIALEQPLELGGQGSKRRAAADAALERSALQLEIRRRALVAEVREGFARALAADERERISRTSADLAAQAAAVAEGRHAEGKISRLARNAAHVEQARAVSDAARAAVEAAQARAEMRKLVGLAPDAPFDAEGSLASLAARGTPADATPAPRLELAEAQLARDEARALRELADADAIPDLTVAASFERELGADRIGAALAFPLPLFETNGAARADARRELARSEAALAQTERTVGAEIAQARARLDAARAAADAFADEAVQALDENVALATEAFRDGDIAASEYVLLRREALEGQIAWIAALEELALAQVAFDRAMGIAAP